MPDSEAPITKHPSRPIDRRQLRRAYRKWLATHKIWWSLARLDYVAGGCFRNLSLVNKSVLEIGAGGGWMSVWCVAKGASRVVALEPELAGSTKGVRSNLERLVQDLVLPPGLVTYLPITIQEFFQSNPGPEFDLILAYTVINHIDEEAVQRLNQPEEQAARKSYLELLQQIRSILRPGGTLVITDNARRNLWGDLGLRNPVSPTIEWHKHQQPEVWVSLLLEAGFTSFALSWNVPSRLRWLRWGLSNRLASYCLNSHFLLHCR